MQAIERVVAAARWRLNVSLFLRLFAGASGVGLALVVVAWLAPKFWSLGTWWPGTQAAAWYGGTLCAGLLAGLAWAIAQVWRRRSSNLDAAVEVDQRFALRERLSSAVTLDPQAAETPAGRALLADAAERAVRIDVRDQFPLRLERRAAWLLVPLLALGLLTLVPDAESPSPLAVTPIVNEQKAIEVAVQTAKKSLEEKARQLQEQGLEDAAASLETLARKIDSVPAGPADLKKETLVKINDVREQLEQKRGELGNVEALKENLAKLRQAGGGALEKLTEALAESDLELARELVRELARKLKAGELSEQERQRLGSDLKKLAAAADQLVQEHEQAKRELEARIRQAQTEGDLAKAADLQKKLAQREALERQMQQLRKAAENLEQAGRAVQPRPQPDRKQPSDPSGNPSPPNPSGKQEPSQSASGQSQESTGQANDASDGEENLQKAQQALEELAEQMEQMESDQAMQDQLQELEQELQDCKDGINGCKNPGGLPGQSGQRSQSGRGEGQGHGQRELEENQTGDYRSKVKARLQKGETVTTGSADGPNLPGTSAAQARELIKSELSRQSDPLEDQQLPRDQREQAKEYFQRLRGGK